MWRVYVISGLIASIVSATTAFVTVHLTRPADRADDSQAAILEGEEQFAANDPSRVIYYKAPFATPPYLTFPEGSFGYEITEETAVSFKAEKIGWGDGISERLKWRAEGQARK